MGKARMHLTARLKHRLQGLRPAPQILSSASQYGKSARKSVRRGNRAPANCLAQSNKPHSPSLLPLVPPEHCRHPHLVCVLQKVTEALPLSVQ